LRKKFDFTNELITKLLLTWILLLEDGILFVVNNIETRLDNRIKIHQRPNYEIKFKD